MAVLPIIEWYPGSGEKSVRRCCAGRVYTPHLYDANANPIGSPDDSIYLSWLPYNAEKPGPAPTCGKGDCGLAQGGSDSPAYGPHTTANPGGKPLAPPRYEIDFGEFFAPVAGNLCLAGGVASSTAIYIAWSYRPLRRGEIPRRWRRTFYATMGSSYTAPHGATGLSSSNGATVTVYFGGTGKSTPLPSSGQPWPLIGAAGQRVDATANGPLSWEISL